MFLGAIALATLVMAFAVYSCNREGAKKVVVMFSFDENQYSYALFRESLEEAFKKRKHCRKGCRALWVYRREAG